MKKNLLLITTFAALFFGCSKNAETDQPVANAVKFGGGIETKATMQGDYSFNWDANDQLHIFASTNNTVYAKYKWYKVTKAAATSPFVPINSESTVSWNGTAAHTFYAVYPEAYGNGSDLTAVEIRCAKNQVQNGASSSHLSKLAIMVATPVTVTPGDLAPNESIGLAFNQIMSFLQLEFTAQNDDPDVTITSVDFSTSNTEQGLSMSSGAKINIIDPSFPLNLDYWGTSSSVGLTITGGLPVTKTKQKAWMVVVPGDHTGATFTITVRYSNGGKQVITKSGVELRRAAIRPVKIDVVVPVPIPPYILTVADGQTVAAAITAAGKTESDITSMIYNAASVTEADDTLINKLCNDNNLTEVSFSNLTALPYGGCFSYNTNIKKFSFPKLESINEYQFSEDTSLEEVDLGLVKFFSAETSITGGVWAVFNNCPMLNKVTLRTLDQMNFYGNSWSSTFGGDTSKIDLVLNAEGYEYKNNISGNKWQGSTFKSITGTTTFE